MIRSIARYPRALILLALYVVVLTGCAGTTTVVHTHVEETFLSTAIAVMVPAPAHPGDAVTVAVKPNPVYQPGSSPYTYSYTTNLYGPFASLASEQTAITSAIVGPPTWQSRFTQSSGNISVGTGRDPEASFSEPLPATLAPGLYDLVVTLSLGGSRATARSDTVVQVFAR